MWNRARRTQNRRNEPSLGVRQEQNAPNEPCTSNSGKGGRIATFGNLSLEPCGFESRPVELGPATGSESGVVAGNLHCEA